MPGMTPREGLCCLAGHAIRVPQLAGQGDLGDFQGILQCPALAPLEPALELRILEGEYTSSMSATICQLVHCSHSKVQPLYIASAARQGRHRDFSLRCCRVD
jgi:hypothetical protein